jgi:hypothetical protein
MIKEEILQVSIETLRMTNKNVVILSDYPVILSDYPVILSDYPVILSGAKDLKRTRFPFDFASGKLNTVLNIIR